MMVGDGMNDAPALAAAHASLSPITASGLAQAASDALFLGERLAPVAAAIEIACRANSLMRQNLLFAVVYNLVAVPLAVAGLATPLIAAAAMSGSSIVVTLNALRASREPKALAPSSRCAGVRLAAAASQRGDAMTILLVLVPLALMLGGLGLAAFLMGVAQRPI